MKLFFPGRQARLALGVGAALLVQAHAAHEVVQTGYVQPVTEPTTNTPVFEGETSLFPYEEETSVQSYDGKGKGYVEQSRTGWRILLGLSASAVYDDNVFLSEINEQEDWIFTITPLVGAAIGDPKGNYFSVTYAPTFTFFADFSDENAVEHAADLNFRRDSGHLTTTANFGFRSLHGFSGDRSDSVTREELIGERVDRDLYVAGLKFNYSVSDKTGIETAFAATYSDYDQFSDTFDGLNRTFVDYAITGKTKLGVGFGIGYAEADNSPEQVYEQALARVQYEPTSKITLQANGGYEWRQVDGSEDQNNLVFGLGFAYIPFDQTTISLDGYRSVRPSSVIANTNYTTTGVAVAIRQRFLGKFYFKIAGGYENTQYEDLLNDVNFGREDDYAFIRPSVDFRIRDRVQVEVFYEYRNNDSSRPDFEFANNRVGVNVGVGF